MRTSSTAALVAAAMIATLPNGFSGPASGGQGFPAHPDERRKKRDAKLARAPQLTAKAEAKRARKANRLAARNASLKNSDIPVSSGRTSDG